MIISNKKSVSNGVKSMIKKSMSWTQACKSISGIGGFVDCGDGVKVRPLELMQSLDVHNAKNSYKPRDIFAAWSARMMKGDQVYMSHSVAVEVEFEGKDYRLYTLKGEKYYGVSMKQLCPVVSAERKKDKTDVVVSPANILKGLQQSVYVDDTLAAIEKSKATVEAMTEGYVNISTDKTKDEWVKVQKVGDAWVRYAEPKPVAANANAAAKSTKTRRTRKSTKKAA